MGCREILTRKLQKAADQYEFATWLVGEPDSSLTGAMRVSGMAAGSERFFVFEVIENTVEEGGIIQNIAKIVGMRDTQDYLRIGNGISLEINDSDGEFDVHFGELSVTIRDETLKIMLDRNELIHGGYLPTESEDITVEALLFKVVDSIPKDLLFSTVDGLKELFGLPEGTQRLFVTETWHHPTTDDIYGGELSPTDFPDLLEMVAALCEGRTELNLPDVPTTHWRVHVANKG